MSIESSHKEGEVQKSSIFADIVQEGVNTLKQFPIFHSPDSLSPNDEDKEFVSSFLENSSEEQVRTLKDLVVFVSYVHSHDMPSLIFPFPISRSKKSLARSTSRLFMLHQNTEVEARISDGRERTHDRKSLWIIKYVPLMRTSQSAVPGFFSPFISNSLPKLAEMEIG